MGSLLVISSSNDAPAPLRKPPVLPMGFKASLLTEKDSPEALLFVKTCAQCHDLPNPVMHTAKDWPEVVSRMINRARRRKFFATRPVFAPEQKSVDQIVAYLSRHALREIDPSLANDRSPAGVLFQKKCTQCHGLPDPKLHNSSEWTSVVERMRVNISRMQKEPISDSEKEELVRYLTSQ